MKNITLKQKQGGFTLLELLVVVAILAIIAGAVISAISGQEERAGQGVTLHTMGALENVTRQHNVLFRGLPNSLDALTCADVDDTALGTAVDTSGLANVAVFGGTSDVPLVGGGVTAGLVEELDLVAIPEEAIDALIDAGITEVRVVENTYCNATEAETPADDIAGVTMDADLDVDLALANASFMFLTPAESELGRANIVPIGNNTDGGTQLFIHQEPGEIGAAADDIVVVLGIGNKSTLVTNNLIGRAPRDGNAPGAHYANFSLALKIGEDGDGDLTDISDGDFDDGVSLVAILDSDGDFFDEEVAEFTGLQDE